MMIWIKKESVIIKKHLVILSSKQCLECYVGDKLYKTYQVSTAKNGLGELSGSECTPRGKHRIYSIIGLDCPINSVFVARKSTNEIYSASLAAQFPKRDWILTRILQLDGLEPGLNLGGNVDSLMRFIYIHGTPDTLNWSIPSSHGCIRMQNIDIIALANWVEIDTPVLIL